jgi:protein-tyrosine phosphatase
MAEGLLRHKVAAASLSDRISVDSAGTHGFYTGDRPHPGTLQVLKEHGIDYRGGARQFKAADVELFDYVLALDRHNLRDMERVVRGPADNLHLFLSFAHAAGTTDLLDVPDPYYHGRFDETYVLIEKGVDALLAHLRATHDL